MVCVLGFGVWRFGGSLLSRVGSGAGDSSAVRAGSRPGAGPRANAASAVDEPAPATVKSRFAAAIEAIEAEADTAQREAEMERFATGLARADWPEALRFLQTRAGSKPSRSLFARLVRRWAESEPRAAADWVRSESQGDLRRDAIKTVALLWAGQNVADAFAWVRQFPEEGDRETGLASLAYELARAEPVKALAVAMELPANAVQEDLIRHATSQLAATEPDVAAWWANQIKDPSLRRRVLGNITAIWGESDPVAAATFAAKALEPGKPQDDAVVGIVQSWVQKKPEEAAAWVASFPAGALRDTSLENVAKLWADQNVEGAGRWLNSLAAGSGRDAAVVAYVNKIAVPFPELARQWTETIQDEAMRARQRAALLAR